MKIFKKILFSLILMLPVMVFASPSFSVSTSSLAIDNGGSKTFTITLTDAKGRVDITTSDTSVISLTTSNLDADGGTLANGIRDWYEGTPTKTITVKALKVGTATITVKMADVTGKTNDQESISGQTKTINVTVSQKSDVNTLSNLSAKNGDTELISGFAAGTTTYDLGTIDASKISISATASDGKAKVSGAGNINLEYGTGKTIVVKVTAENGAVKNYTLKYVRKDNRDTDNTLSDLKVDGVTVSGFRKDKLEYTLNETLSSTIKIEATCSSTKCSKIAGTGNVNLEVGNNDKKVTVYAENGSTQIYTIKISRKEDTNLSLTKLVVDGVEIPLTAGKYTYTLEPTSNSTIKVEATASNKDAKLEGVGTVNLVEGNNSKEVTITSKTGNTTQIYYLNIVRKGALDKVTIDGTSATPSADGKSFNYEVPYNTEKVNLKAVGTKENYTTKIILKSTGEEVVGEFKLADQETNFVIEVTNENGTTSSYDLVITKADAPVNDDAESETSGTKISSKVLIVVIAVLLVVNIILAIYCVGLNNKKKKKDDVDVI